MWEDIKNLPPEKVAEGIRSRTKYATAYLTINSIVTAVLGAYTGYQAWIGIDIIFRAVMTIITILFALKFINNIRQLRILVDILRSPDDKILEAVKKFQDKL